MRTAGLGQVYAQINTILHKNKTLEFILHDLHEKGSLSGKVKQEKLLQQVRTVSMLI